MAGGTDVRAPTFRVRFESYDDFLVEYTDRLRHGRALLPLPNSLPKGSAVRLRVHLPNDRVLNLHGRTEGGGERAAPEGPPVTLIVLAPFNETQLEALHTCVSALVPSSTGAPEPIGPTNTEPHVLPGASTVLLVDDSVSTRIELSDALRTRGIRVRVADNGLVALSAALKRPPDLVLTDVEMPVMDGWSLLRTIRGRKRLQHIPIVFLTRLSDEMTRLRGYRMGVDDYLPKSMPHDEIVARLQGVLARRRIASNEGVGGMHGQIEHVRLGSLLAFLESERRSGALSVSRGDDHAMLHLRDGTLEQVDELGRCHHPHDRVFELLSWEHGQFEFIPDAPRPDTPRLGPGGAPTGGRTSTALSYLLMEHARREDESQVRRRVDATTAPHPAAR